MSKKTVIITGANSGIGKEAALLFAMNGYSVIMACRDIERSKLIQNHIIEISQNKDVDLICLDLASMKSIKEFCAQFIERYQQLDILIHNAGSYNFGTKNYQFSPDGIELTFAINTFGPLVMNHLLRGRLTKSKSPKILNASSVNINWFKNPKRKIDFNNLRGELKDEKAYNVYKMYGDSKMSLTMQTMDLAIQFSSDNIKVNALQIPDIKHSKDSLRKMGVLTRIIGSIMNPFLPKPKVAAKMYYAITTSEEFNNTTGELIHINGSIQKAPKYTYLKEAREQNQEYNKAIVNEFIRQADKQVV